MIQNAKNAISSNTWLSSEVKNGGKHMSRNIQPILLVRGFDPYDLCCLILSLQYVLGTHELSPQILMRVLKVVDEEMNNDFKMPTLEALVSFLLEEKLEDVALELMRVLFSIKSYAHIQDLVDVFRDSIILRPDDMTNQSKYTNSICKASAICLMLPKIFSDPGTDQLFVEDIQRLWNSIDTFVGTFRHTSLFLALKSSLPGRCILLESIYPKYYLNEVNSTVNTGLEVRCIKSAPWLITTHDKFRLILNHEVTRLIETPTRSIIFAEKIIRHTTLNDRTLFPDIIILEIILLRKTNNYEELINKIYQYFDYCRNSKSSYSSSSLSYVCQTFVLSTLYQDYGSTAAALKTLHELIDNIREKSGVQGLANLWDVLLHHLVIYPNETSDLKQNIYELLKPLNEKDNSSSYMMEYWYSCQLLLGVHEFGDVRAIFEAMTKLKAISGNGYLNESNRVSKEVLHSTWKFLGFNDVATCFGANVEIDDKRQKEINSVKTLQAQKRYSEVISILETLIRNAESNNDGVPWKLWCMREVISTMVSAGNSARAQPKIKEYVELCLERKNDHELSFGILLMAKALITWNQYEESYKLLSANLDILLQFSDDIKDEAKKLFEEAREKLENSLN